MALSKNEAERSEYEERKTFALTGFVLITSTFVLEKGRFQSGQMGRTVNPLSFDFSGSNPLLPTDL